MFIQNYHSDSLNIDHFAPQKGEAWSIYGTNVSGIDEFVMLLSGDMKEAEGLLLPEKPAIISFARQQEIFEDELRNDNSNHLGYIDPGTPAHAFVNDWDKHIDLIQAFHLRHCKDKGYRQLSSGESRKLILLGALSKNPSFLLLENPYDGIDKAGCEELDHALGRINSLNSSGPCIIVTVNNKDDIPEWCSHLAIMHKGSIRFQGPLAETLQHFADFNSGANRSLLNLDTDKMAEQEEPKELIRLTNGFARYGDVEIFSELNFKVENGEHTLLTGPNGSGKSTLLQIITGDNQNCYANDLQIFGIQRGSGESIWQLKKDMGIVSPDLHRNHYIPGSPLQVVLSGFFDSIGIYNQFSLDQKNQAMHWLEMIGLQDKSGRPFRRLSYAEQRLCLIARALIKMPRLLILDEPTQGLDQHNRSALLDFLETIAARNLSTILYASHRTDEFRDFFKQHVDLTGMQAA
jgi:molybdate transport system ATP-binding protein